LIKPYVCGHATVISVENQYAPRGTTFHFHKGELTSGGGPGHAILPEIGWDSALWVQSYNNRTGVLSPVVLFPSRAGGETGTSPFVLPVGTYAYGQYVDTGKIKDTNWQIGDLVTFPDECYAGLATYDAGMSIGNFMSLSEWGFDVTNCGACGEGAAYPFSQLRSAEVPAGARFAREFNFYPWALKDPLILDTNGWKVRVRMRMSGDAVQTISMIVSGNVGYKFQIQSTASGPSLSVLWKDADTNADMSTVVDTPDPAAFQDYMIFHDARAERTYLSINNRMVRTAVVKREDFSNTPAQVKCQGSDGSGSGFYNLVQVNLLETWTPSPTPTPTETATMVPTATPSTTRTASHTRTHTASSTPSATTTPSPSRSTTRTLTLTRTRSATRSSTASPTPTPTESRTQTGTRSPTQTLSRTSTSTRSQTLSQTRTPSRSRTQTGTTTPSQSRTASETPTPTDTPTSTLTTSANGTVWEHYNCRPCSDCVEAGFSLSAAADAFSLGAFCTALRATGKPGLANYTSCEQETCIMQSAAGSIHFIVQFRVLPGAPRDFKKELEDAINDASLSVQLQTVGLGTIIVATVHLTGTYTAPVNATLTNHLYGRRPPFVGTAPAFQVLLRTSTTRGYEDWAQTGDLSGLLANGILAVSFPPSMTFVGALADVQLTIDCLGACPLWTGPQAVLAADGGFNISRRTLSVDFGTRPALPGNISNGDLLSLYIPEGVVQLPGTCDGFVNWVYLVETRWGDQGINMWLENPADDDCIDLCNACKPHPMGYECEHYDHAKGLWFKYTRATLMQGCHLCSTLGQSRSMCPGE